MYAIISNECNWDIRTLGVVGVIASNDEKTFIDFIKDRRGRDEVFNTRNNICSNNKWGMAEILEEHEIDWISDGTLDHVIVMSPENEDDIPHIYAIVSFD